MNDDETSEKLRKLLILKTRMLKLRKREVELKDHNETLFRNTLMAVEREMLRIDPAQVLIPTIHISQEEFDSHHQLF